jgi:hypothetical protein
VAEVADALAKLPGNSDFCELIGSIVGLVLAGPDGTVSGALFDAMDSAFRSDTTALPYHLLVNFVDMASGTLQPYWFGPISRGDSEKLLAGVQPKGARARCLLRISLNERAFVVSHVSASTGAVEHTLVRSRRVPVTANVEFSPDKSLSTSNLPSLVSSLQSQGLEPVVRGTEVADHVVRVPLRLPAGVDPVSCWSDVLKQRWVDPSTGALNSEPRDLTSTPSGESQAAALADSYSEFDADLGASAPRLEPSSSRPQEQTILRSVPHKPPPGSSVSVPHQSDNVGGFVHPSRPVPRALAAETDSGYGEFDMDAPDKSGYGALDAEGRPM